MLSIHPMGWLSRLLCLLPLLLLIAPVRAEVIPRVAVSKIDTAPVVVNLPLSGTVTALRRASLSPRLSGLVAAIHAEIGDEVSVGQKLLSLDDALVKLALERARAAATEAETRYREAQRLLSEAETLFAKRTIPETRLRALEAEAAIGAAAWQRLQAEEREQAERVARHQLKAPFAGVIAQRYTDVGEWLDTGTPAFELVATQPLVLDVQVPQNYSALVTGDTPVSIRFDGFKQPPLQAKISIRVPVKDPLARTFLARIRLDTTQVAITPGMSATATLSLDTGEYAPLVPRDAVLRGVNGKTFVWVLNGQNRVARRAVELGRAVAGAFEVQSGLQTGERVVIRGNEVLQEGQTVLVDSGPNQP